MKPMPSHERGFTLIEALAATTILVV